ncbi:hypothetical protein Q1695_013113 [Nippostrongylus brasiliensis]|nr:hypothetical protein Q1695_013113 [Nippostrongylus brasiliensis]
MISEASMELARMGNEPRPIKSDDIRKERFKYRGPLKLDAGLKGEVKHLAPDNEECDPNMKVEFDQRLNEIVDIGTNIEVYEDVEKATDTAPEKHSKSRERPIDSQYC